MAVKKYSYKKDKNVLCSPHTTVREMASIGQGKLYSDTVLVDTELMDMVEKLFAKLNCKKYIISSGYRTSAHEVVVGGNGKGYHTKGQAVDACFYGRDGKIIPAPVVCCVAQDLGFGGIANISQNYRYVHLDIRKGKRYLGDEIKSLNTVTDNFYNYFGITKTQVAKYTGETVNVPEYYNRYVGTSNQIDAVLRAINVEEAYIGGWKKRKPLAGKNGISLYVGSASQNIKLVSLAKKGKLRRV